MTHEKMRFTGSILLRVPREQVWQFLTTPEKVTPCVPLIQSWQATADPFVYTAELLFRWGDQQISFSSQLKWSAPQEGEAAVLEVQGESAKSHFTGLGRMRLTETFASLTELSWLGEAEVGGNLGQLPTPVLKTAALLTINRFLETVKTALEKEVE